MTQDSIWPSTHCCHRSGRVKPRLFAALVISFATCGPALRPAGAVTQDWVSQYNGLDSYWEEVSDAAVRDGFVYVTGFSYVDFFRAYATVKYDYSGREIWARVYEGGVGPNQPDEAEALTVDSAGNVYVTGWSLIEEDGGASFVDAATLKYDAQGELIWEHRYRSEGANNQPNAIALDGEENILVAGASWVNGGFDLMVLKYAPDGTLLWDRTLGQSGGRWDSAYDLAVDADGAVAAAGYTEPVALNSAAYLVKYNADGDLLWESEREGFSNVDAWERVEFDADGNLYVLGEISPPAMPLHIWTNKYDADGNLLWENDYGGTASFSNYTGGLAVDPNGGVAVCGQSWDLPSVISIVTLKYEADGALAWQRLESAGYAHSSGQDVAIDSQSNVYSTGFAYNQNGFEDIITLAYTSAGDLAWTQVYADPNGRSDYPETIAVDENAGVFVTGDAWVGFENYYDYTVVRYSQGSCEGDANGDGTVDPLDAGYVLARLGCPVGTGDSTCDAADANADGAVDPLDAGFVLARFGACS